MAKDKTAYVCSSCGYDSPKWIGKCPACGEWNTFQEVKLGKKTTSAVASEFRLDVKSSPISMSKIETEEEPRIDMGDGELNRVLGGGLVPGSMTLLGGEPGIGKSTLILQTVMRLKGMKVLYVSGEESARQLKLRADRINLNPNPNLDHDSDSQPSSVLVVCEAMIETVFEHIKAVGPDLVVIDSIQTMATETVESSPGSVTQIRECAAMLLKFAKETNTPVIVIGHINKEGTIAGPKILEHMVDTVLYFEGDRHASYRLVRAVKNRFGSTNEMGVFEMCSEGLTEVKNPSEFMLSGRPEGTAGSVVACAMEGTRPLMLEVQALVCQTNFQIPRRTAAGTDYNRVNLLLAVLEKRLGLKLAGCDAYINLAGGMRLNEPAIDLAIVAAVISSYRNAAVESDTMIFGEVGLTGEVRAISQAEQRVREAEKLGFKVCCIPQSNMKYIRSNTGIRVIGIRNVKDLYDFICTGRVSE